MNASSMDAAAKQRVKDAFVASARAELEALQENAQVEEDSSRLDQDSSFSIDDLSQADEAADLSDRFQQSREYQSQRLAALENLDVAPTGTVTPGAIVGFDGNRFLVGAVSSGIECDGTKYAGISGEAPIFAEINGLTIGDTFTFRDREHRIDFLA